MAVAPTCPVAETDALAGVIVTEVVVAEVIDELDPLTGVMRVGMAGADEVAVHTAENSTMRMSWPETRTWLSSVTPATEIAWRMRRDAEEAEAIALALPETRRTRVLPALASAPALTPQPAKRARIASRDTSAPEALNADAAGTMRMAVADAELVGLLVPAVSRTRTDSMRTLLVTSALLARHAIEIGRAAQSVAKAKEVPLRRTRTELDSTDTAAANAAAA